MRKTVFLAGISYALFLAMPSAAQVKPDLTEQLSYPFLTELVAAEHADRVAWVSVVKGVRTIWTATGPDYRPRQVFSNGKDDGQELSNLVISPDGRAITWVQGGDHDANWEAQMGLQPNPGSGTDQPRMEIWHGRVGGAASKVADGDAPALSTTGRLAFVKDGVVWSVDPSSRGKPERLLFDRGKARNLAWSPDGRQLAFVSDRGDHSFVGIYSRKDQPILWLAPSTEHDEAPVWSPDGMHIAFTRRQGDGGAPAPMLRETPHPWSIWVADAGTGEGHLAWKSSRTRNASYPQVPGGLFLAWAAGDRLIFRAEMDGWPHLYALPAAGGDPLLLTPGRFMVDRPIMAADRRSVVFDANTGGTPGDEDRRHLFRASVDRPGVTAITRGDGIETAATPVGRVLMFISATAQRPAALHIAAPDGSANHSVEPASAYPSGTMVIPRPVTWTSPDGLVVHGQLFQVPGATAKKPAIVFVHGGPPRQMLLGWSYMDYYSNAYAVNQYLAQHGFVVLSINYRLGIGYGRAFQHPEHAGPAGSSEYQDVLSGARFLATQPGVDGKRIGIWGGSYGGLLTALALARNSDVFKAGVDFHGVHDWSRTLGEEMHPPVRYEKGDWDEAMKVAFESSPVAAVSEWRSPVLFIHGDDDRNVRFNQTIDLERRLDAQDTAYAELVIPNEIHGFLRWRDWLTADAASISFFEEKLHP
uniref:S9 family peptidase n=1 Tax=Sphingomonas sp. TaxID=28214 RepID=UPI0025F8F893|nr:prolyl oligopeptidase family serine peptidase [Sphingomonas sp.]